MRTTYDSFVFERPAARDEPAPRSPWVAPFALAALVSGTVASACFLQLAEADLTVRTSRTAAHVLALLVGLLVAVAIPLRFEARLRDARRRLNPLARPAPRGLLALAVTLLIPVAAALLAPDLVRAGLQHHADWAVRTVSLPAARAARGAGAWVAARIPTDSPLAVTHATSLRPARDPACVCR